MFLVAGCAHGDLEITTVCVYLSIWRLFQHQCVKDNQTIHVWTLKRSISWLLCLLKHGIGQGICLQYLSLSGGKNCTTFWVVCLWFSGLRTVIHHPVCMWSGVRVGFDRWGNPKIWCRSAAGKNDSSHNNSLIDLYCELWWTCFLCGQAMWWTDLLLSSLLLLWL